MWMNIFTNIFSDTCTGGLELKKSLFGMKLNNQSTKELKSVHSHTLLKLISQYKFTSNIQNEIFFNLNL